jgi:hypothetical protein
LLFWGWQTDFLVPAVLMAVILEGARWLKTRWEFSEDDFSRIWTFCTLVLLGVAVYAFTTNNGPADILSLFQNPSMSAQRGAAAAGARTAATLFRWLPMIFFLFVAAQALSYREGIPLEAISFFLKWRRKRARKLGRPLPPSRTVNVSYPYFAVCSFAASSRARDDSSFFWGLCGLMAWALWSWRPRRFALGWWAVVFGVAIGLGFLGQRGASQVQRYLEGFNTQWLSGLGQRSLSPLRSQTALGRIGRLKTSARIVVRVESPPGDPPPALLREAAYRMYKNQTWYENSRNQFENVQQSSTPGTWVLVGGKTNVSSVNIACYLDHGQGLLPLPETCGRLENLSVFVLSKDKAGAVLANGPGLVVFDACYGPGLSDDAPPTAEDTEVPPPESAALERVLGGLQLSAHAGDQQARQALNRFFQNQFSYSMWQEPRKFGDPEETPLSRFLLRTHRGHCEYFATATVLLMRKLGVPARYAVGYAVHEGANGKYVVRQRDAHAWCMVWNERASTWQDFDTTPASWIQAESQNPSPLQAVLDALSRIAFEFSKFRWGQSHLRNYFLWALVPVLGLLLYQIVFRSQRKKLAGKGSNAQMTRPGLDSEFYEVERKLARRGITRSPGEPLYGWLARASDDPGVAEMKAPLEQLLRLHYRYRFDPLGLDPEGRNLLRREARTCLARLPK